MQTYARILFTAAASRCDPADRVIFESGYRLHTNAQQRGHSPCYKYQATTNQMHNVIVQYQNDVRDDCDKGAVGQQGHCLLSTSLLPD